MNEKPLKPPVLRYRRTTPESGLHIQRWNWSVAVMLVLGPLGAMLLIGSFVVSPPLSRLLAVIGGSFLIVVLLIWQIERDW